LICSTNRDPFESIKDGNLREDLYYRINTIELTIPPLRDRMEDVPMLAEHFLQIYGEKYKKANVQFSQNAYNQMLNYTWRGNVRELEHAIERAVLLSRGGKIESMDLLQANGTAVSSEFPAIQFTAAAASMGAGVETSQTFGVGGGLSSLPSMLNLEGEELFEEIGRFIVDRLSEPVEGSDQKDVFNDIESGVVLAALKRTRGNKQAAANLLGLYRPRLYGMIKRHNLEDRV